MAFFGLTINANSTQEVAFPEGAMLSISQIALDEAKDGQTAIVQLQIAQDDFMSEEEKEPETKTYTICKLTAGKVDQLKVSLKLFSHEEAKINVKGQGVVHITGFLTPDPSFDDEDMEDEDEDEIEEALAKRKFEAMDDEDDEEEMPAVKPPIKQQKTPQAPSPSAAKPQPQQGGKPQGQQGGKPQGQQGGKPQGQQGGKPQGQQGGKPQGQQGGKPGQGKKGKGGKN